MTLRRRWCAVFLVATFAVAVVPALVDTLGAASVAAQEAEAEAQRNPGEPATTLPPPSTQPQPVGARSIPQNDILATADQVAADLRRVNEALTPTERIVEVQAMLAAQEGAVTELRAELDRVDPDRVSSRRVEDQRVAWLAVRETIANWSEQLQSRWTTLQQETSDLEDREAVWAVTEERATADSYPPELTQRIAEVRAEIAALETRLAERNEILASLADRVSRLGQTAVDSIARLETIAASLTRGLFERDGPPIWRGLRSATTPAAEFREAGAYWLSTLRGFVDSHLGELYVLLFFFFVFVGVSLYLRARSRRWPADEPAIQDARACAALPISTALAFTVLAQVFLIGDMVGPAQDVMFLVATVPFVRLGSVLLARPLRHVLYGSVGLYLVSHVWRLVAATSATGRAALWLTTLATLAATGWLIHRWRGAMLASENRWWRLGVAGLTFAAIVLAASLGAVTLGWVRLARLLTSATLLTAAAAMAWIIAVRVLVAFVPLALHGPAGRALPSVRRSAATLSRAATLLFSTIAFYMWATGALERVGLFRPLRQQLGALLSVSLAVGGIDLSFGGLLTAILVLALTPAAARLARFVLSEEILPRLSLPPGVDYSMTTLVGYTIWVFGILTAAAAAGFSGTQMTVVFGAIGVGIGFGLQAIVNNFVSGLILMFERPLKVGDRLQTATHAGRVTSIGIRASTIRTYEGADVVVPNGDLITKEVTNWTLADELRRVEVRVGVAYGSRPREVLAILERVALDHPATLDDPPSQAQMMAFGESSLDFRLRAWVPVADFLSTLNDLHVGVEEALREAGIKIPYPRRDVLLRSESAGQPPTDQGSDLAENPSR